MHDQRSSSPEEALLQLLAHYEQVSERREERRRRFARRLRAVGLLVGTLLALALLVFNVLVWGGFAHIQLIAPESHSHSTAVGSDPSEAARPPRPHVATRPPIVGHKPTAPSPVKRARSATLVLTAVRGDSWVMIRAGSAKGRVLFQGIVRKGESTSVKGKRLWARFGAAGNLDLRLDGKPVRLSHTGTVDAVISASGAGNAACASC